MAHEILLVLVADILYIRSLELGVVHSELHTADAVFAAFLFDFVVLVDTLGCEAILGKHLLALVVEVERALVLVVDDVDLVPDDLDGLLLVLLALDQLLGLVALRYLWLWLRLLLADLPPQRLLLLAAGLRVDDDAVVAHLLQVLDARRQPVLRERVARVDVVGDGERAHLDRAVAEVLQVVLVDGVDLVALHVALQQVGAVHGVLVPGLKATSHESKRVAAAQSQHCVAIWDGADALVVLTHVLAELLLVVLDLLGSDVLGLVLAHLLVAVSIDEVDAFALLVLALHQLLLALHVLETWLSSLEVVVHLWNELVLRLATDLLVDLEQVRVHANRVVAVLIQEVLLALLRSALRQPNLLVHAAHLLTCWIACHLPVSEVHPSQIGVVHLTL